VASFVGIPAHGPRNSSRATRSSLSRPKRLPVDVCGAEVTSWSGLGRLGDLSLADATVRWMSEAIVAALIGAAAVVIGVFLAQRLIEKHEFRVTSDATVRTLNEQGRLLYEELRRGPPTSLQQGDAIAQWLGRLNEVEVLATRLHRDHRLAVLRQVDEARAMWVGTSWRILAHNGSLPESELLALLARTNAVFLSMKRRAPIPPLADLDAQLKHYVQNGLDVPRPGAPTLEFPVRGVWRLLAKLGIGVRSFRAEPRQAEKPTLAGPTDQSTAPT